MATIETDEVDISDSWTDEDYRDFSDASFALVEARLNEVDAANTLGRVTSLPQSDGQSNGNCQTADR